SGRERDALKLLYHLGTIHYFLNDQQKAIQCYEEAKALQKDYSESQKTAILPVMLAKAFTKSKQFDKALDELDQAIVHCKKYEHIHILAMAYEQKSTTYELLGNNEKALEYSKKYALQLKENQQHSERAKISEILGQAEVKEIIDLNDKLEAENQLKNEQITSQKRQTIIYLLLALLIIGVILAVFRTVYFRNKIFKTQNKLLSNKVDNLVNTLKEKANLIADLEAIGAATPELSEKISTLIKDLRQGRDWVSFMNEFKVLNQRFFERLNEKATTSLTKNDLRMATLIKLDCTLKEIAEISSITYDGAVKAKQRLSKKFDLEAAAKLDDFIKSL
ncbi:MAG: tetratricopeptide repeat protein, partial [Flavobacteriales bacterium]|nr:tetratricopeptide repeat protein [Flavobacteriales bacterium]